MNLNAESFNIVGSIGTACEVGQVELDLIPSFLKVQKFELKCERKVQGEAYIEPHGHGANKWFHPRRRLVVASTKTSTHVLVIEDLNWNEQK